MENKLRKYCLYTDNGAEWIDIIRIYVIGCDGMARYIVQNVEEEGLYVFDSLSEALEFIKKEYIDKPSLRVGECP
jgi:hypothetical protein